MLNTVESKKQEHATIHIFWMAPGRGKRKIWWIVDVVWNAKDGEEPSKNRYRFDSEIIARDFFENFKAVA